MRLVIYKHLVIDKDRPLVFLDMDGVFNGGFQHEHYDTLYRDDIMVRPSHRGDYVLKSIALPVMRMLKEAHAQVILVSSWFSSMIDGDHPQAEEFLDMFGILPLGSLETSGGDIRGKGVSECLAATRHPNWIIVDDCGHFYPQPSLAVTRLVVPSGRYGMQGQDIEALKRLL